MSFTQVASAGRTADRAGTGVAFMEYPPARVGAIGTQILPITPVAVKKGAISAVTRESVLGREDVRRNAQSAFSRGGTRLDEITFDCKGYGFEHPVDKAQRELYRRDFDADEVARQMVYRKLEAEREIRIAAKIFDVGATGWYSSTSALYTSAGTDWDSVSATIIGDIEGAKQKVRQNCGLEANTLVVSSLHLPSFIKNTEIRAALQYNTVPTVANITSQLSGLFGLRKVLIGSGVYNSAEEGGTLSISPIWSDDYAWVGVTADAGDSLTEACVGRSFNWDAYGPDQIEWDQYYEPQTKSDVWQGEHWTDEKVIDVYFGHVIRIDS